MTKTQIVDELARIGSTYRGGRDGWHHIDPLHGAALVRDLSAANRATSARTPMRQPAWGRRGEPGTVVCDSCGKRGQDIGAVCDHCGHPVR